MQLKLYLSTKNSEVFIIFKYQTSISE